MKERMIILTESPHLYSSKRLAEEAGNLKIQREFINPYQSHLIFDNKAFAKAHDNTILFHRTTGTRYDDYDLLFSKYYSHSQARVFNSIEALSLFRAKDTQQLFFIQNQLPFIKSIAYRGRLDSKIWDALTSLSKDNQFIVKMVRGNKGIGVNLVSGLNSLKSILETFESIKDQKFIIQPFIVHKREFRVFFIKNRINIVIEKKISSDDFRGNANRSSAKLVKKVPTSIELVANKIIEKSGLFYGGIDIIYGEDNIFVSEVNPIPGFEQVEHHSKLNIAKELILSSLK